MADYKCSPIEACWRPLMNVNQHIQEKHGAQRCCVQSMRRGSCECGDICEHRYHEKELLTKSILHELPPTPTSEDFEILHGK